jgi:hypothetical protein
MPAIATASPARAHGIPATASLAGPRSDDELLAFLLISTWMVRTGRRLRAVPDPADLSREELIEFWSDDVGTIDLGESATGQR